MYQAGSVLDVTLDARCVINGDGSGEGEEEEEENCSFLDPAAAIAAQFVSREVTVNEGGADKDSAGLVKSVTLVLHSTTSSQPNHNQNQKTEASNALTTLLGEYRTVTIEKSSSTLSIRDIEYESRGNHKGGGAGEGGAREESGMEKNVFSEENTRTHQDVTQTEMAVSRGLRDVDDPTVSVVAWLDCTEVIVDGVLNMGYCSHQIEDGFSVTSWVSDKEARTNITSNDAMWFRTELFDDMESFGAVEIYKQSDERNMFTANVDIGYPENRVNDWFVMNFTISEREPGDGLVISTSIYDDEGTLDISTGEGLVVTGTMATPGVQYISVGLSLPASSSTLVHGHIDITSRKDASNSLFQMSGGVNEIDEGLQLMFSVNHKKGVANFTGGRDLVHIRLTDGGDEVMEVHLRVNESSTSMEVAISDPKSASADTGDLFRLRLDLGWTLDELLNGVNVLSLHQFSVTANNEEAVWVTFRGILDVRESNETHRFDIGLPELDVIAELTELTFRLGGEEVCLFGKSIQVRDGNPLRLDIELPEFGYDFIERLIEKYLWTWFRYDPNIDISNIDPNVITSFSNASDNSLFAWVALSLTQGTGGDLDYLYAAVDVEFDIMDALHWDILLNHAYVILNEQNDTILVSDTHLMLEGSEITNMAFNMPTMNVSMLGKIWHGAAYATINETNIHIDIGIQNEKFIKEVVRFELNVDMHLEDLLLWHINITEVDFFFAGMQVIYFELDTSMNGTDLSDMEWLVHEMVLTLFNDVWAKASQMRAVVHVGGGGLEIGFEWTEALENVIDTGAVISWDDDDESLVVEFSRLEVVFGTFVLVRGTMNVTILVRELFDMSVDVLDMYLTLFNHKVGADIHIDGHIHVLDGNDSSLDMALVITEATRPKYFMGMLVAWEVEAIFDLSLDIIKAGIVVGDDKYVLADLAMNLTIAEAKEGVQISITDLDLSLFNFELAADGTGSLGITTADGEVDTWILITDGNKHSDEAIMLFDARFTATARFNETREHRDDYSWLLHTTTDTYARQITAAHIIAKQVGSDGHYILLHSPHTFSVEYTFSSFLPESVVLRLDAWELTLFNHEVSRDLQAYALASWEDELAVGMGIVDGVQTIFDMGVTLNITHIDKLTDWRVEVSKLGVIVNNDPWASFVGVIEFEDDFNHDLYVRTDVEFIKFPFDEYMYDDLMIHLALNVSEVSFMLDVDVYDNTAEGVVKDLLVLKVFTTMRLEAIDNFTVTFDQLAFEWNGKQPNEIDMSGARVQMTTDL
jgi:hypothetical protein